MRSLSDMHTNCAVTGYTVHDTFKRYGQLIWLSILCSKISFLSLDNQDAPKMIDYFLIKLIKKNNKNEKAKLCLITAWKYLHEIID